VTDLKASLISEMQEELFLKQGQGWFRIVSGSMRPLIDIRDRVLAKRVDPFDVQSRDIILFKNSNALVTHRIMERVDKNRELFFLQKGDGGGSVGMIPAQSVLGKVVAIEKNGTVLRLDRGRGRIVNTILGINSYAGYQVTTKIAAVKEVFGDKRGFQSLKLPYRGVKKLFILLNRAMVRVFASGIWMMAGTKRAKKQKTI